MTPDVLRKMLALREVGDAGGTPHFGGSNRKKSEKYGLKVGLCGDTCHRNGRNSAHQSAATALRLHQYGQMKFMSEQGATVDDFRAVFGKNYL